jgi:hypothetical protein
VILWRQLRAGSEEGNSGTGPGFGTHRGPWELRAEVAGSKLCGSIQSLLLCLLHLPDTPSMYCHPSHTYTQ